VPLPLVRVLRPIKQKRLTQRAEIFREIRRVMENRGYLEVDTPQRVRSPGTDVNLDAFESEERYLITSPEFHMKRLLTGGLRRIYSICHCFRKGEKTALHNPEFTMLEFYATGLELEGMMKEVEEIIWGVAQKVGVREVHYGESFCNLNPPWPRISVDEAFKEWAGWSPLDDFNEDRFYYDLVDKVERHLGLGNPTILYDYPPQLAMLARIQQANPSAARRFEVYMVGVEVANAFEELTDPDEQRKRFEKDLETRRKLSKPLYPIDEAFLDSLAHLPDCSGTALGVDRLVMLLTGAQNLAEVIAFPDGLV